MWARWALKIQQFSFTIRHLKGKLNIPSDVMSRREYPLGDGPITHPTPRPKPIRVQSRGMLTNRNQIQEFKSEDPPRSLYKLQPSPILKDKSTHHFYTARVPQKKTQCSKPPKRQIHLKSSERIKIFQSRKCI